MLAPALKKRPERRQRFKTTGGLSVHRLYLPPGAGERDYVKDRGFPGSYPFTRGIHPTMYRGRLWTMRQYAGFGDAEETNRRYRYLLSQGQTGLSVAFDLCTQIGYDSDSEMSRGEVGRVGVAIDSLQDMELLFEGIPLGSISTSMTINAPAAVLLAMYIAVAEQQQVPAHELRGTLQNDILKEYVARGTYIFPPAPSMRLTTDLIGFCAEHVPQFNSISVSGYHMREAGSTASQEVGFTLAHAIAYVEAASAAGIAVDRVAKRLSFFFSAHNDVFEEVAKYRAARRLWAKTVRERLGAKNAESMMLRFHVQTAGCSLTAQQPENNIVRVTLQALAAAAGGTQSLHTNSYDEALALPSEKAATVALRTQQIMAHESGVANTADPFGGSYYVEALTDRIEKEAQQYIAEVDRSGGAVKAIEQGTIQAHIQDAAFEYQSSIESKERTVVGVNQYISDQPVQCELLAVDQRTEQRQITRLQKLRASRDGGAVAACLDALKAAARSEANLMPPVLEAVKQYCTVGEICDALREVFGEFRDTRLL